MWSIERGIEIRGKVHLFAHIDGKGDALKC
jgi:hypothetical protein